MAINLSEFEQLAEQNTRKQQEKEEQRKQEEENRRKQKEKEQDEELDQLRNIKSYILSEDFENWLSSRLNMKKEEIKEKGYFSFNVSEYKRRIDYSNVNPYGIVETEYNVHFGCFHNKRSVFFTFTKQCGEEKSPHRKTAYSMVREILDLIEDRLIEITKNKFIIERREEKDGNYKTTTYYIRFLLNE